MRSIRMAVLVFLVCAAIALGISRSRLEASASSNGETKTDKQLSTTSSKEEQVARGRYLVVELARCPDCHTPRDPEGKLNQSRWLQGGPVWIRPVESKEAWALQAPALAHFAYSDKQAQDILERGIGTNGNPIQPPMHAYHLHHDDAMAIIAYLRSL
jgi:mono/diheme cytochrome c family protein